MIQFRSYSSPFLDWLIHWRASISVLIVFLWCSWIMAQLFCILYLDYSILISCKENHSKDCKFLNKKKKPDPSHSLLLAAAMRQSITKEEFLFNQSFALGLEESFPFRASADLSRAAFAFALWSYARLFSAAAP